MKQEVANSMVYNFNNDVDGIRTLIVKEVNNTLGITTDGYKAELVNGYYGLNVRVECEGNVTDLLTATPLLQKMFKSGSVYFYIGYPQNYKTKQFDYTQLFVDVKIAYEHPNMGSNGLDLFRFGVDLAKKEIIK